ncbi:hypothetical protein [Undibacterium sp. TJN19]|uniref:hypothetical protein n=1 Tax=Undibacterium sp. TJN19 TaxID=3413055 RepID=UPI003BF22F10
MKLLSTMQTLFGRRARANESTETSAQLQTQLEAQEQAQEQTQVQNLLASAHYEAAEKLCRLIIQKDERSFKAYNSLGFALQLMGRTSEAMQAYQAARTLNPDYWQAAYNIGNLYKLTGQLDAALSPFYDAMVSRRKVQANAPQADPQDKGISQSKLLHDIEQLTYLISQGEVDSNILDAKAALEEILHYMKQHSAKVMMELPASLSAKSAKWFNRFLHYRDAPALAGGALNPDIDWAAVEDAYFANAPGMTYIDNFLKPEALASLRRFCLESTFWFDYQYLGEYVGCTIEDGFVCPLLLQIAEEQKAAMPRIFGDHAIHGMWGYKYDSERTGISIHADFAAINVNFWLAPDEANLDPNSGGLVIWDKEAPLNWEFDDYNNNAEKIAAFLQETGAKTFVVPHRQNRAALFNSDLFHKTDNFRFKPGYENRRINVTMLFGDRRTG